MNDPSSILYAAEGDEFHVPGVIELFEFVPLATFDVFGITFRIDLPTLVMFGATLFLSALFFFAFARATVVPTRLQNLMEAAIDLVRDQVVAPILGSDGERWMPFLTAIFFFVFGLNIWGIIPVVNFPVSSRMAYPVFLAGMIYVVFNVVGIKQMGPIGYFKSMMFPPGVPIPVYIILAPIELFSTMVVRPLTLAVRLFANMMAGHVMLAIFFIASAHFLYGAGFPSRLTVLFPFPFVLSVLIIGFELFISVIQAFIMTILAAVYIQGASHAEH